MRKAQPNQLLKIQLKIQRIPYEFPLFPITSYAVLFSDNPNR